jgi:hypothetical protein
MTWMTDSVLPEVAVRETGLLHKELFIHLNHSEEDLGDCDADVLRLRLIDLFSRTTTSSLDEVTGIIGLPSSSTLLVSAAIGRSLYLQQGMDLDAY